MLPDIWAPSSSQLTDNNQSQSGEPCANVSQCPEKYSELKNFISSPKSLYLQRIYEILDQEQTTQLCRNQLGVLHKDINLGMDTVLWHLKVLFQVWIEWVRTVGVFHTAFDELKSS